MRAGGMKQLVDTVNQVEANCPSGMPRAEPPLRVAAVVPSGERQPRNTPQ